MLVACQTDLPSLDGALMFIIAVACFSWTSLSRVKSVNCHWDGAITCTILATVVMLGA